MKYILSSLFFIFFVLSAHGMPLNLPDNVSVIVMQANDGKILFEHRAKQAMTPASTTKILTAYTALQTLGPDYFYKTQVYQNDKDLWVKFSGDPSLTGKDLQALITEAVKLSGLSSINHITIDHDVFAGPWVARGWAVDDTPWYYAAPVHGIIIDENQWILTIQSPDALNQPVSVRSANSAIKLDTQVMAVDTATSETLCQLDVTFPKPYHVVLRGCWPQANPPQNLKVANQYPVETAQTIIFNALSSQNIALQQTIKTGTVPSQATLLVEHHSAPLSALIKPVLQDSNNLYTESLTKTLGATAYGRPTFQAGSYYIQQSLKQQLRLPEQELILTDGSGVSFLNLISAHALAQTLHHAYMNAEVNNQFIDALSYSGRSGTLKTRLEKLTPSFAGKTGSMSHVSALAGYHGLETNNPLIYVIMVNQAHGKASKLKRFEDELLTQLITSYFTNNSQNVKLSSK